MKLTKSDIKVWIEATSGDWFELADVKKELQIDESQYGNLRKSLHDLCTDGICESMGGKTGRYRRIDRESTAVKFWETGGAEHKLIFPRSVIDSSYFSFEDKLELEPVSIVTIGGVSNSGKTALAMGILLYSINSYYIKYYSNENNRYNFWKRIKKVDWIDVFKVHPPQKVEDCLFEYIPRRDNYADVIFGADMYIIDWINLADEIWKISRVIEGIKTKLDAQKEGIAVVVLQKDDKKPNPRGDTWVKDHSDLLMTIDFMGKERRLTITKCKVNGELDGKTWGFGIEEGIKLKNIREIISCSKCHASGKVYDKLSHNYEACTGCLGLGYRDKEKWQE